MVEKNFGTLKENADEVAFNNKVKEVTAYLKENNLLQFFGLIIANTGTDAAKLDTLFNAIQTLSPNVLQQEGKLKNFITTFDHSEQKIPTDHLNKELKRRSEAENTQQQK